MSLQEQYNEYVIICETCGVYPMTYHEWCECGV